jgi:hypothetical protein
MACTQILAPGTRARNRASLLNVPAAEKEIKEKLQDGPRIRDFAVVTNRPSGGLAMIQWNRDKASAVQYTEHIVENQLMAGHRGACPSLAMG